MILNDQPTIFDDHLVVGLSSVEDGNMDFGHGDDEAVRRHREGFLSAFTIDPLQTTVVRVTYTNTTDFTRYQVVDEDLQGEGVLTPSSSLQVDALVTVHPDQALLLPLADCTGAVIFDPVNRILMMSHLGRHSVEADGGTRSIRYLSDEFGTEPESVLVWLSPAVGSETYPLFTMNNRGLHEVIIEQMLTAGVQPSHIEASQANTAEDENYFSHSEFLAGHRSEDGRVAIVAMMRE